MLKFLPFIRLLIPFIVGILFASVFHLNAPLIGLIIAYVVLFIPCCILGNNSKLLTAQRIFGVSVFLSLSLAGWIITENYCDISNPDYFAHLENHTSSVILQIDAPLSEKQNSYKTIAKVKYIVAGDSLKETSGKVLLMLNKSDSAAVLQYGDLIYAKTKFEDLSPPKNPDEFDYSQYLNNHNIYRSAYLNNGDWQNLNQNKGNTFLSLAYSLRRYCLSVFNKFISNNNGERGVVSALVLGYRDNLDPDIENSFANVGVIHIIAVAGLHVGLLFSLLILLLKPLPENRTGNLIRISISLSVIWLFALVTGLPGSVLRASTMFSFIVIGKYSGKNYNTFNLLAASAFFLLLCDPFLVKDVGFQLSFTAVAGILYLYPKLYAAIDVENKLLDKVWSMACLSISAQVATLPLILFYFNQFPAYFIISNIVVVPLAALILYLTVALIILGKIAALASVFGWLIYHLTSAMDFIIANISHLPLAIYTFSAFNSIEVILLFALILLVILFLQRKTYSVLQYLILTAIIFFLFISIDQIKLSRQQKVYHLQFKKIQVAEVLSADTSTLFIAEDLSTNKDLYNYYFKQHWRKRGIKVVHWMLTK
jgi:competence protein ComEC